MTIKNWGFNYENETMRGYILKAYNDWNKYNPEKAIPCIYLEHLLQALTWATDDMTAEEAYNYYCKN